MAAEGPVFKSIDGVATATTVGVASTSTAWAPVRPAMSTFEKALIRSSTEAANFSVAVAVVAFYFLLSLVYMSLLYNLNQIRIALEDACLQLYKNIYIFTNTISNILLLTKRKSIQFRERPNRCESWF